MTVSFTSEIRTSYALPGERRQGEPLDATRRGPSCDVLLTFDAHQETVTVDAQPTYTGGVPRPKLLGTDRESHYAAELHRLAALRPELTRGAALKGLGVGVVLASTASLGIAFGLGAVVPAVIVGVGILVLAPCLAALRADYRLGQMQALLEALHLLAKGYTEIEEAPLDAHFRWYLEQAAAAAYKVITASRQKWSPTLIRAATEYTNAFNARFGAEREAPGQTSAYTHTLSSEQAAK